jgi:hypothetical protein
LYKRIIQPIESSRTGLGLAISNQLLALMDKLQLISMYGDGRFFFEIKFEKFKIKNNKTLRT